MDIPPTKKSLGQHWLHDEASLLAMCEAARLQEDDVVLEIGPGPGTLTQLLAEGANQVIAVEFDEKLARELPGRVKVSNLKVINEDILRYDFSQLPAGYKVIANIPYYLTSHLIRRLSETQSPPQIAVLLLQKEVAERVAAKPGDMSLLSVTAQYYWRVRLDRQVPAHLFTPPPKVDSQILVMERLQEPPFPDVDTKAFFRLVKAGFAQRRKTLLNSLSAGLQSDRETVSHMCDQAGINPARRAQTLSLDEWHALYQAHDT
jgi:16S rRNA (adenine1518-N6/adenine1519-N6)-dimethyltransferase